MRQCGSEARLSIPRWSDEQNSMARSEAERVEEVLSLMFFDELFALGPHGVWKYEVAHRPIGCGLIREIPEHLRRDNRLSERRRIGTGTVHQGEGELVRERCVLLCSLICDESLNGVLEARVRTLPASLHKRDK